MRFFYLHILFFLYHGVTSNVFSQSNQVILKAWAIEQEISGGAPPSKLQKPIVNKSIRFFIETTPNSKVKIVAVWIGHTPYAVFEEQQNKSFPDRDYKPADFDKKNNFIQVLATDSLTTKCIKIPTELVMKNEAVIVYTIRKKIYNIPIKIVAHERINLP